MILLFGTKRLKGIGADVGEAIKGFRKSMHEDDKPSVEEHKGETLDVKPEQKTESTQHKD